MKTKKVGIVTIIDNLNYGNILQNYATQVVLKSLDCYPITLNNKPIISSRYNRVKQVPFYLLPFKIIKKIKNRKEKRQYYIKNKKEIDIKNKYNFLKEENFLKFKGKYIESTNECYYIDKLPSEDFINEFDFFISGSDQVWNYNFRYGSPIDFLTFVKPEKRIAYSASFGISEIPYKYKENYKKWLSEMSFLSVREDAGAKIIKDLTGRQAAVLVDPTMMLNKEEWFKISQASAYKPKKPYLCTYFLGETYEAYRKEVNKIAKDYSLEIVNLGSVYDLKRYSADPSEFLNYIASAELFLTDSFHGAIFSIIFSKPFIVFERLGNLPSMNSRIDTLLSKFKFGDRKWDIIKTTKAYFNIDFSHVPSVLECERQKVFNYLENALVIKDE